MEAATKRLFKPTSQAIKEKLSDLIEVQVSFGTKSILGEIKYEHQRRLLCPANTPLQQVNARMMKKI